MARVSNKKNKNIYHITRENLHLTREEASELLATLAPERIEKIENERTLPHPDEVLVMAEKYQQRLIEITVDGEISENELKDFILIQEELERISIAVETLQLWSERMLATGKIDPKLYQAYKENGRF